MTASQTDFHVEFNALLVQARAHGLSVREEPARRFLEHTAELLAQRQAEIRALENALHERRAGTL